MSRRASWTLIALCVWTLWVWITRISIILGQDQSIGFKVVHVVLGVGSIAFGLAAWTPLLAWNMDNAEAGLRFQLVERHPWAFHADGISFLGIQALLVTPLQVAKSTRR